MTVTTEIRSTEERILQMCKTAEEMLQMSYETLKHEQIDLGDMAEKLGTVMREEQREILESVVERARHFPEKQATFQRCVAIVAHLERISDYTTIILQAIRDKMEAEAKFSAAAMRELKFLFESLQYLLRCARDAIQTGNPILSRYIADTANTLDASADQSARDHEARVLRGECAASSSPIFLDLLDSLKGIVRHMKLLAERLSS